MISFRRKPKLKDINLSTLQPKDIEYFCKTSEVDQFIMQKKKLDFDKSLADAMETHVRYYFIVKKNLEYDVISGVVFEPWLEKNPVPTLVKTPGVIKCLENYNQLLK